MSILTDIKCATISQHYSRGRYAWYGLTEYRAERRKADGVITWRKAENYHVPAVRSGISDKFVKEVKQAAEANGLVYLRAVRQNDQVTVQEVFEIAGIAAVLELFGHDAAKTFAPFANLSDIAIAETELVTNKDIAIA